MTMELDKMKHIWQNEREKEISTFDEEKVMKRIQERVEQLSLNDKKRNKTLIMGIICLGFVLTAFVLSFFKENGYEGPRYLWAWGPASLFFFYQYLIFSKTPLHNQPVPVFIKHVLKRIQAKKYTRWGIILCFAIAFFADMLIESLSIHMGWNTSAIIFRIAVLGMILAVLSGIYTYQKYDHIENLGKLEKELKKIQKEIEVSQ